MYFKALFVVKKKKYNMFHAEKNNPNLNIRFS